MKILVGGCSFTNKDYPSTARPVPLDFKMWPELLQEKTGKEVINTAKNGYGNEAIFNSVVSELSQRSHEIDEVIVAWSEWTRLEFMAPNDTNTHDWYTIIPRLDYHRKVVDDAHISGFYRTTFGRNPPAISNLVNKNIQLFYSLKTICNDLNIKLNMFQMLYPIPEYSEDKSVGIQNHRDAVSAILWNDFTDKLDDVFWNFPPLDNFGGKSIWKYLIDRNEYTAVSDVDRHPDAETQKRICEIIHKKMVKGP